MYITYFPRYSIERYSNIHKSIEAFDFIDAYCTYRIHF